MGLLEYEKVGANVGEVLVLLQEPVPTEENLSQPLQDLRVVEHLMLDQLLRDRVQHLRATRRNYHGNDGGEK